MINKNWAAQIERTTGHWFLKFDGQFGWSFGFLKHGKKRCSDGLRQTGYFRRDELPLAIELFEKCVQEWEEKEGVK